MKKYLITGFSGFVAYHFLAYLNSVADEETLVLGLDRIEPFDYNKWNFTNIKISFNACDLTDSKAFGNTITTFKPTYILHLAAVSSVGQSWEDPAGCFFNNTCVFLNIMETVRKNSLDCKILCIGSSEEYGTVQEKDLPLKEDMPLNPENPYAVTKMSQEAMSRCYVNGYNMDICMTRSFNHIGPRQRDTFVIASFAKQFAKAAIDKEKKLTLITGNLSVARDFLDVRDVVCAYYLILKKGKKGELYNVCSGNNYKLRDIIDMLSEISGVFVTTKTNQILVRPNDIPVIYGCNDKIKKDTGWMPIYEVKQSLTDIFNYWKEMLSK